MGWWKIDSVEYGGIAWSANTDSSTINTTKNNTTNELVNGDRPADIMGKAIDKIRKEYKDYWKREPKIRELQAVFNFVTNPIELVE